MSAVVSFVLPVPDAANTIDEGLDRQNERASPSCRRLGTARVCFPETSVNPTLADDPSECGRLPAPIFAGADNVVYGSR